MNQKTLIIIRGLPGSGKTTLARLISTMPGAVAVAADDFPGRYNTEPPRLAIAHEWCQTQVRIYLELGVPVVIVHNTFVTRAEIEPYAQMAQEEGYRLIVLTVEGSFYSEHDVPDYVLERMKADWEPWAQKAS